MSRIVCPLCRQPLDRQPRAWRCAQGHSFDVAREGYVNLLPVQHKNSRDPGDNPEMVRARREFLQAGHYRPLRDAVTALLSPLRPETILDIGCGEGYYTGALKSVASEVIGLDVAKPAIQLAAKRFHDVTWLVGSNASLPLADQSVDWVCTLFTPLHVAEMHRVLAPEGQALVVTPAADHLWTVRQGLFDDVRTYEPGKFLAGFAAQFDLVDRLEIRCALDLTQQELKQLLLMTPYAWKARPDKRAALENRESFRTQAAFSLMRFRRRAGSQLPPTTASS